MGKKSSMLRTHIVRTFALVLASVVIALVPAGSAVAQEDEMTIQQAGRYYMKSICAYNGALNRFNGGVWGDRDRIEPAEVRRRLPELKRLSEAYSVGIYNHARRLYNPPAEWPVEVRSLIRAMSKVETQHADIRLRQSGVLNAAGWLNLNGQANRLPGNNRYTEVRARLNLPPRGQGC